MRSVNRGILFFNTNFFVLSFSFADECSRLLDREATFTAQKVGYRCNFTNLVQNFGEWPPLKSEGSKILNFPICWWLLRIGPRYCQSKNGLLNWRHSSTRLWKNGVLRSTMKYVIVAHSHPPCDLFSSLFTKRLDRWRHMSGRYSDLTKQRQVNPLVSVRVIVKKTLVQVTGTILDACMNV